MRAATLYLSNDYTFEACYKIRTFCFGNQKVLAPMDTTPQQLLDLAYSHFYSVMVSLVNRLQDDSFVMYFSVIR